MIKRWLSLPTTVVLAGMIFSACGGSAAPASSAPASPPASSPAASVAASSAPAAASSSASVAASSSAPAASSAAASSSASASPAASAGRSTQAPTGTITFGTANFPPAYTLATSIGSPNLFFEWLAFDALTWVDPQGKLQPDLATSWNSPDGKTWTFKLRTDIKFQDGTPFEAQDVVGTFNWYKNPANKAAQLVLMANVDTIQAPDPATVVIALKSPQPSFPKLMGAALIVKGRDFNANDPKAIDNYIAKTPVGTGPMKLANFTGTVSMEYDAMPPGFVSPRGSVPVSKIIFKNIADEPGRISALKNGAVQIVDSVSFDQIAALKSAGLSATSYSTNGVVYVPFNTASGPTKDVRVRQALNYAIDRESIIKNLRAGVGFADSQMLGSNVLGYNSAVQPYPYDPTKAKQLLADAGYANGLDLGTLSILTFNMPKDAAEAVTADLAKVGVKTTISTVEVAQWVKAYYEPTSTRQGLWVFGVNWDQTWEADSVYRWWSSDLTDAGGRRWDDVSFNNVYEEAKKTLDDTARAKLYQQNAQYIHDQAPVLFLWSSDQVIGFDPSKVDFTPGYYANAFTHGLKMK